MNIIVRNKIHYSVSEKSKSYLWYYFHKKNTNVSSGFALLARTKSIFRESNTIFFADHPVFLEHSIGPKWFIN